VYVADQTRTSIAQIPLATPPSVTFADTNVGTASLSNPQKVTVGNNGYDPASTNPLTFSGVSTGTPNFVLDATNACTTSTSLEPGQTCALAADFTPQMSGTPLTDAVTLSDNNLNNISSTSSPQSVPLSGNGLQQTPVVTVASATFGYGRTTYAFTASVSFAGTTAPIGAVTFNIDNRASILGFCTGTTSPLSCTSGGSPTGTVSAGTHTITATIAASPGFLQASGSNTLTVTQAALTVNIIGSPTKVYDGTTTATLTPANYQVGGLVGSDSFTVNQTTGTYSASNASPVAIPLSVSLTSSNFTVVLGSLANYSLPSVASGNGFISPASSVTTVTCSPNSVTYNG